VHFYYLESTGAYNLGANGTFVHDGIYTHAGLGVWDVTTNQKFSIELLSPEGVAAPFFPAVDTSPSSDVAFTWHHAGIVHTTFPLDEAAWGASHLITKSNGAAFNKLAIVMADEFSSSAGGGGLTQMLQPVTVVQYAGHATEEVLIDSTQPSVGTTLVQACDAFSFVRRLLSLLGGIGCDTTQFVDPRRTLVGYLAATTTPDGGSAGDDGGSAALDSIPVVVIETGASARGTRLVVANWYAALRACAQALTGQAHGTGNFVNLLAQQCYKGGYAYLYRDDASVYNITLAAAVAAGSSSTPLFTKRVSLQVHPRVISYLLQPLTPADLTVYVLCSIVLPSFLVCDVSLSLSLAHLLLPASLHSLTPHDMTSNHHPLPYSSINHQSTQRPHYYYLTGTR
jgi:hypothetical protein